MNEFDFNIVANPEIFSVNRLPVYSDHIVYASEAERAAGRTSYRMSLNGEWYFSYADNMTLAAASFEKEDYVPIGWNTIRVPAHIQMEGYDKPHYTNTTYPWEAKEWIEPGQIPSEFNPVASYIKYFYVPDNFNGNKVCISFQGVESGFALWINGQYVGYSEDSFDQSDYDITKYLKEGKNKIAVRVWKFTSSSWCEDQDFFRFSGIFRDVYLYCTPKTHVKDLKITAGLSDDYIDGDFNMDILCEGHGQAKITLYDSKLYVVHPFTEDLRNRAIIYSGEVSLSDGNCNVRFPATSPKLWSAEEPNLYVLLLEIYDENGKLTEVISQNVGFRRFEMIDGIMHLNGKRIVFKGVNRHEFSSVVGRVPLYDDLVKDIKTMKRNNINGVRTCHYPDCSKIYEDGVFKEGIYDLCDVYGLYMIAENNMETHGSWEAYGRGYASIDYTVPNDKPEWREMLLDRINSCYQRDKNHPAILIWSVGNESNGGTVILDMANRFRELDSTRLVHYEGIRFDRRYPDTSDIESQMYTSVEDVKKFLKDNPEKPFICCEYTHAMGNSCGGMHLYTDLTDTEMRYQGGFIWDYVDQSIYKKDRYGNEFLAYGGDFDDRPSDYEFSGNGIVYGGERNESPKMQEVKYNYQNISVDFTDSGYKVINKNLFVNTNKFNAEIIMLIDGEETGAITVETCVEPLSELSYEYPESVKNFIKEEAVLVEESGIHRGEKSLILSFKLKDDTIWGKAGHEVAFGQHVFKKPLKEYSCCAKPVLIRGNNNIGVKGENFSAIFARLSIGLVSYVYAGKEMLKAIPKPNFWRAPTNNDEGNMMPARYSQWKIASMYVSTKAKERFEDSAPVVTEKENTIEITYIYRMPTTPASECKVSYEVFGDGTIKTTMKYDPVKELGDMPEFGMLFKLDADYDHVKWYGLGPAETYCDRFRGGKLLLHNNLVKDNMAEYLVPQECGNKCEVRYAKVTDRKGRGMLFYSDEMSFSALPYTPHELENASHVYELPPVHSTVIRAAKQQMGVAGDDSWGAVVHPQYLINIDKPLEFSFYFKGI